MLDCFFDSIFFPVTPMGEGDYFSQKAHTGNLNPKEHEEYGRQLGKGPGNSRIARKANSFH